MTATTRRRPARRPNDKTAKRSGMTATQLLEKYGRGSLTLVNQDGLAVRIHDALMAERAELRREG